MKMGRRQRELPFVHFDLCVRLCAWYLMTSFIPVNYLWNVDWLSRLVIWADVFELLLYVRHVAKNFSYNIYISLLPTRYTFIIISSWQGSFKKCLNTLPNVPHYDWERTDLNPGLFDSKIHSQLCEGGLFPLLLLFCSVSPVLGRMLGTWLVRN